MKQLNVFATTLVLTCCALLPAASQADDMDDLDVTMTVLDDASDLDAAISEMEGPDIAEERDFDDDAEDYGYGLDGETEYVNDFGDRSGDGFDSDEDFDEDVFDDDDEFEDEDEFDEFDDIDDDEVEVEVEDD